MSLLYPTDLPTDRIKSLVGMAVNFDTFDLAVLLKCEWVIQGYAQGQTAGDPDAPVTFGAPVDPEQFASAVADVEAMSPEEIVDKLQLIADPDPNKAAVLPAFILQALLVNGVTILVKALIKRWEKKHGK
jgi:hypothetical protein